MTYLETFSQPINCIYKIEKDYIDTLKSLEIFNLSEFRPIPNRVCHIKLIPRFFTKGLIEVVCRVIATVGHIFAFCFKIIKKSKQEIKFEAVCTFGLNPLQVLTTTVSQLLRVGSSLFGLFTPYHALKGFKAAEKLDLSIHKLKKDYYIKFIPHTEEKILNAIELSQHEKLLPINPENAKLYYQPEIAKSLYDSQKFDQRALADRDIVFTQKLEAFDSLAKTHTVTPPSLYGKMRWQVLKNLSEYLTSQEEITKIKKAIFDADKVSHDVFGFGSVLVIN